MAMMTKRWYRPRRNVVIVCVVCALCVLYYFSLSNTLSQPDLDLTRSTSPDIFLPTKATVDVGYLGVPKSANSVMPDLPSKVLEPPDTKNRTSIIEYIENTLEEALKLDKGMGCEIPKLDPFSREVTKFDKKLPGVHCKGQDWVKCYHSRCRAVDDIKETVKDITCKVHDILYQSDKKYTIGPVNKLTGDGVYELDKSDHIKVACTGTSVTGEKAEWSGNTLGFRKVTSKKPPPGREDSFNVLIFGFDSTARNGFIRRMPKSWKVLTEELGAVVMEGFNVVGDGTPATLFPMLTGKTELELPDVRKSKHNDGTMDSFPFIFYKLKEDGYRTAYFEDMPQIGTFQYRFNGFRRQPADHYLRAFYLEEAASRWSWKNKRVPYCVGDTPQFKLMMNITEQFMELEGKRFAFTFIADITHDDYNMVQSADDDTAAFLRAFRRHADNTLLVVMGDHGPRYANVRDTLQGKLEERLPLMALLLPAALVRARPGALAALRDNALVLTTPHDLHATLLDVLGMRQHWNPYKLRGADLPRGLTMLEPIPRNRSCSEAGIEPHWCACVNWQNVSRDDPLYARTAAALLAFINSLLDEVGSQCEPRTLLSVEWVLRQRPNNELLAFSKAKDADGYVGHFGAKTHIANENYQIKIILGPGRGVFEAALRYVALEDQFRISARDISRTNAYTNEPDCISATHPHLNNYCYCRQNTL